MNVIRARLASFGPAIAGIAALLRSEPNARLHGLATCGVVILGWVMPLTRGDWLALVLAITAVWVAEALNTAIEALCDTLHPDQHPGIKRTKDVAAGAVLLAACGALITGMIVFGRHLTGG